MKTSILLLFLVIPLAQKSVADSWTQKADLPAQERDEAIAFTIGNYAYVGTGYSNLDDIWQYDPSQNTWTPRAPLPNQSRYGAISVSSGSKGYAGLGAHLPYKNDWWEYDPIADAWTQKSNFQGTPREFASAFCIDNFIYAGCGLDSVGPARDWWKYNVNTNTWSAIDSLPTAFQLGSFACVSFAINNKGYVITGYLTGQKVFEYDPVSQTWATKNPFPGTPRYSAAGFAIGDFGYIGTGDTGYQTPHVKDFWQYVPATDQWYQKNDFSGPARIGSTGFTIGGKGYLALGHYSGIGRLKDLWEYTPDSITSISQLNDEQEILFYPNPVHNILHISPGKNKPERVVIYSITGEKVLEMKWKSVLDLSGLKAGNYLVEIKCEEIKFSKILVKE